MLKGKKVVLRMIQKDDVEHWLRWYNDAEVLKYLSPNVMYGVNREKEEEYYNSMRKFPGSRIFTIETHDGKVVGNIGLHNINSEWSNAEISIMIGEKQYWGKGFAADAISVMIEFAFNRMNLHRVYLHVNEANTGGIRCYEKAGFIREGVLREAQYFDGKYSNIIVMGILREEFEQIL
jgi:RimJ/RimL family protein N-acetyltransferase